VYEARRFKGRQGRGKKEYETTGCVSIWVDEDRIGEETKQWSFASDRLTRVDKTKEAILSTCNPRPREEKTQKALGFLLPPTPPLVSLLFCCTEQNTVLGLSHNEQNIHTLPLLAAATVL